MIDSPNLRTCGWSFSRVPSRSTEAPYQSAWTCSPMSGQSFTFAVGGGITSVPVWAFFTRPTVASSSELDSRKVGTVTTVSVSRR